ncbi:MAG: short chain dehydrogenase [Planctomycetota bacterium]|jgi:NAD(P)-dependent dehydrogenase (short-subunit alcohol dehydrogenase family)
MKIIIVGASGRIGTAVAKALQDEHEIVRVHRSGGDLRADYTDAESVQRMFAQAVPFDACICAAGPDGVLEPYVDLTDEDYRFGFEHKFLSQVRLVTVGTRYMRDNGCFVLSSGHLSEEPTPVSVATGPMDAAVNTFVASVAPLLPRGIRVNVVSPTHVAGPDEAPDGSVTAKDVAAAYVDALTGESTGQVLRVWGRR